MGNEFNEGDLVWAKVIHHPWWPGIIYHEPPWSKDGKEIGFFAIITKIDDLHFVEKKDVLIFRHRRPGRYEAHLWDKEASNATQKKGKQAIARVEAEEVEETVCLYQIRPTSPGSSVQNVIIQGCRFG
ncbi:putative PWWP domain-containing protein [Helianthus debilis subsp. tardiflorus]